MRRRHLYVGLSACVLAASLAAGTHAYNLQVAKWYTTPVTFVANPTNADVSSTAAEAALQAAMNVWNTQSGSSFRFQYGGRVSDTSTSNDGRNVVIFRSESNGTTAASTYTWWNGSNQLVDADIVFWDGGFTFFTGSSGCSGGVYIEDMGTHEFGHALGLTHTTDTTATMYPTTQWCSQNWRTLEADDIAGATFLYPATSTATNTAPTVAITTPTNGVSVTEGVSVSFSGSATDKEDGSLTAALQWTDNGVAIGQGGSFTRTLTVGTHTIVAWTTDSAGVQSSKQVSISVAASTPSTQGPILTATGRKLKGGYQVVDLTWSGITATSADVFRNNTKVVTTPNDGVHSDATNKKGAATYTYRVCAAGTTTCTNTATVTF